VILELPPSFDLLAKPAAPAAPAAQHIPTMTMQQMQEKQKATREKLTMIQTMMNKPSDLIYTCSGPVFSKPSISKPTAKSPEQALPAFENLQTQPQIKTANPKHPLQPES